MSWPAWIDVIVVNYHSADSVCAVVARLLPWHHGRIHIVDNSEDLTQWQALQKGCSGWPEVICYRSVSNIGFGAACNTAFVASKAEFVLLLNPDAVIEPQDIEALGKCMEDHPRLGALAPSIFWAPGKGFLTPYFVHQSPLAELKSVLAQRSAWMARLFARLHLRQMQHMALTRTMQKVPFLSGAVLMVRRAAALPAARLISPTTDNLLFDPAFFMFFEDSDLSVRLRLCGWLLGVLPTAQAVHEYRHKPSKTDLMQTSRLIYFAKRFGMFFRLTHGLHRLQAGTPTQPLAHRHLNLGTLDSASQLMQAVGGDTVLGFSPSPLMVPIIFRPPGLATNFSEEEWALLEPGIYFAELRKQTGQRYTVCWEWAGGAKRPAN